MLPLTDQEKTEYQNAKTCPHCNTDFNNKLHIKVKHHDHTTGRFLIPSKNAFYVMETGKVVIRHAPIFVRKLKIMSSVFLAHAKTLKRGTAKYPIKRTVCKSFAIPQNYLDFTHEILFSGQLPTRIVIGLVSNQTFSGHADRNLFNF